MKNNFFSLVFIMLSLTLFGCNSLGSSKANPNNEVAVSTSTENNSDEGKVIQMTKAMFIEKVYNYENQSEWNYLGDMPAIIDFYADWCGPCKMIAPILDELAKEYKDKLVIYKVNTDKERELAGAFGIRSIPAILFIPLNGQPQMSQGALPKSDFQKIIKEHLFKDKE